MYITHYGMIQLQKVRLYLIIYNNHL